MTLQNSQTSIPLDLSCLSSTLQKQLPFSVSLDCCVALAGDASNRRYYRLQLSGAPFTSLILMQLADPEEFKASEEAVGGKDIEISHPPLLLWSVVDAFESSFR